MPVEDEGLMVAECMANKRLKWLAVDSRVAVGWLPHIFSFHH